MFLRLFSIAQANTKSFLKSASCRGEPKHKCTSDTSEQPAKSKVAPLENTKRSCDSYTPALQYTIISNEEVGEMSRRVIVQTRSSPNQDAETVKICTTGRN